ncbi:MAG TPA: hypothetical protein VIG51_04870 [Candidatus Baltobacteraceae bacterium]
MIFPLAALSLTLVVDGSVVRSYTPAYLERGRVLAPVDPFLTAVADSIGYDDRTMIVSLGDRFSQIRLARRPFPGDLHAVYVEIAPILRNLGEMVRYDSAAHVLYVKTPGPRVLAMPTPFNPAVPRFVPTTVFTPTPATTPRPVFTGAPIPRRTPIPLSSMAGPSAAPSPPD